MRYKTLPKDGEIDAEVALLQGASALDAAAVVAEITNDVEGLLNVAAMWMKLGEAIEGFATSAAEAADTVVKIDGKFKTGFQCGEPDIAVEEDDDAGN